MPEQTKATTTKPPPVGIGDWSLVEAWVCDQPARGVKYRVLQDSWRENYTIRLIYEIEIVEPDDEQLTPHPSETRATMTEPIDHRAAAAKWLTEATDIWNEPRDYDDPPIDQLRIISRALMGIGHALLAQPPAPPEVPQRFMCPTCEGRGWIPDNIDSREDCPNCHGDGYVMLTLDQL